MLHYHLSDIKYYILECATQPSFNSKQSKDPQLSVHTLTGSLAPISINYFTLKVSETLIIIIDQSHNMITITIYLEVYTGSMCMFFPVKNPYNSYLNKNILKIIIQITTIVKYNFFIMLVSLHAHVVVITILCLRSIRVWQDLC